VSLTILGVTKISSSRLLSIFKSRGIVVYLYTPVELQLQRTYRDKNRPLLQVDDPEKKLRDLLSARDPLYREIAHYIIETNQGAARELAQKILQLISSQQVK
jgi:shikimate kinase